ncbi:TetR family transcriptional regulator [Demequina sp. SYSU T00068]|uniref:TetR/AcrR family transcriptional regulator n=1 Tax=Demequina lignilytica TaxID=3051663 RepID=UPI0026218443|nr:TetR family transcriptional regulator [Demequina sp. SYSU T00068]MDN4491713.1 TetR family transcriptional regulator [Demequina sp. SYSU T00068]
MPRTSDKPERLRAAAFTLTRDKGVDGWTLADVAAAAGVPAGSIFYHFRTKEAMVLGVADELDSDLAAILATCALEDGPVARLTALLDTYGDRSSEIVARGTAIGTLAPQLRRAGAADRVVALQERLVGWIAAQFEELGFAPAAARARALHLLSGIEGAAALAYALGDPQPLDLEAAHLARWVSRASA